MLYEANATLKAKLIEYLQQYYEPTDDACDWKLDNDEIADCLLRLMTRLDWSVTFLRQDLKDTVGIFLTTDQLEHIIVTHKIPDATNCIPVNEDIEFTVAALGKDVAYLIVHSKHDAHICVPRSEVQNYKAGDKGKKFGRIKRINSRLMSLGCVDRLKMVK